MRHRFVQDLVAGYHTACVSMGGASATFGIGRVLWIAGGNCNNGSHKKVYKFREERKEGRTTDATDSPIAGNIKAARLVLEYYWIFENRI